MPRSMACPTIRCRPCPEALAVIETRIAEAPVQLGMLIAEPAEAR